MLHNTLHMTKIKPYGNIDFTSFHSLLDRSFYFFLPHFKKNKIINTHILTHFSLSAVFTSQSTLITKERKTQCACVRACMPSAGLQCLCVRSASLLTRKHAIILSLPALSECIETHLVHSQAGTKQTSIHNGGLNPQ